MPFDIEKLLLEIHGAVKEIKIEIKGMKEEMGNMKAEHERHVSSMKDLEERLRKVERIVYAGLTIAGIIQVIVIRYIIKLMGL